MHHHITSHHITSHQHITSTHHIITSHRQAIGLPPASPCVNTNLFLDFAIRQLTELANGGMRANKTHAKLARAIQ
jgi:hypothetical protein